MSRSYFWGSAVLVTIGIGAAAAFLFPYGRLGIEAAPDRERAWLLIIWTAGVLAICFGASGLLGTLSYLSFRDVAEAGSVSAAIDARRQARQRHDSSPFYNFAGWLVSAGGMLVLLYFAGWLVTGR